MNVPDVSLYQGDIDWPQVAQAGITHAIVKLSEGVNIADPKAVQNCDGARAAGITVDGYHFARCSSSASANAQQAIARAQACGVARVWLDFEDDHNPLNPDDSTAWALTFLAAVSQAGLQAGFYTFSGYTSRFTPSDELAAYPLWLANYGNNSGAWPPTHATPHVPAPWNELTGWQHTSVASVPGIPGNVDMSTFADEPAPIPTPTPTPSEDPDMKTIACYVIVRSFDLWGDTDKKGQRDAIAKVLAAKDDGAVEHAVLETLIDLAGL